MVNKFLYNKCAVCSYIGTLSQKNNLILRVKTEPDAKVQISDFCLHISGPETRQHTVYSRLTKAIEKSDPDIMETPPCFIQTSAIRIPKMFKNTSTVNCVL